MVDNNLTKVKRPNVAELKTNNFLVSPAKETRWCTNLPMGFKRKWYQQGASYGKPGIHLGLVEQGKTEWNI